ncbi:MAG: ComEC/Rec2 family competence protein [Sulfurimonas sp.]|nr:ComEC/Rec2 family competence protein [Sulfurimonas sp.]MDD5203191.1 ComEC/Rec2 family competence protein [Sulfurimonas sp.]
MLERVSLFSTKRELFFALGFFLFILCYSLLIEYQNYKNLTRFDTAQTNATILKQYKKIKTTQDNKTRTYHILKLKSHDGYTFYTTTKLSFAPSIGKEVTLILTPKELTFYAFMSSFFAYSYIIHTEASPTLKQKLNNAIAAAHENQEIANIYQALYSAASLETKLQAAFSNLGVSHLLAISGFHLGILSMLLYFLLRSPYKYIHERLFPYRHQNRDLFIVVAFLLLLYLLFLDSPPSVMRAFAMLVVGFFLYDRGLKIISMQTLFVSILLLLAFFPRLVFALGYWLSVAGVFYIFLFLLYFKEKSKLWQFLVLPFWVYLLMLPYALVIFGNFSFWHPLSILWTSLFTLFYPLSIFLHLIGFGDLLDGLLESFIAFGQNAVYIELHPLWLGAFISLSLLSIFKKIAMFTLLMSACSFFIYAVYHIT